MDNLAHSLFGAALARAGLARACGRGTTLALVLASNAPDLDFPAALIQGGDALFLSRRCLTHSAFGGPAIALAAAALLKPFLRELRFRTLFLLCLLGVAGHVLLDLVNAFGVVLLFPASDRRFELGWVFIMDPVMWVVPGLALLRWNGAHEKAARVLLGILGLYLALCAGAKARAGALLEAAEPRAEARWILPEALGAHRWRGIAREGNTYRLHLVHVLDGRLETKGEVRSEDGHPSVEKAKATERGKRLLWFAGIPVWRGTPDGGAEMDDLRFRSFVAPVRRDAFRWIIPP